MKRTQIFIALFFAGMLFAGTLNASPKSVDAVTQGQSGTVLTAQQSRILKAASFEFDIAYTVLRDLFFSQELEIIDNGDNTFTVTVYQADGNPLIATLEDYI